MRRTQFSLSGILITTALAAVLLAVAGSTPRGSLVALALGFALFAPMILTVFLSSTLEARRRP